MDISHTHGGVEHAHSCSYSDGHLHPEEVPSPGNEPAVFPCTYYANSTTSFCLRPAEPDKLYCKPHCEDQRRGFSQPVTCSIRECENVTNRHGQPCDPCDKELGVG